MKTLSLTLVAILLSGGLFAQEDDSTSYCGTEPMTQEKKERQSHYGNNRKLLTVLKKHGFEIPEDYFDNIDSKGLYLI